jgi:TP53 regulating kinase-like protein
MKNEKQKEIKETYHRPQTDSNQVETSFYPRYTNNNMCSTTATIGDGDEKKGSVVEGFSIRRCVGVELISQGAEARMYRIPNYAVGESAIVKERFTKQYRHPILDKKLTKQRVIQEARCIVRARKVGVDTPFLYSIAIAQNSILMEEIQGRMVKEILYAFERERRQQNLPKSTPHNQGDLMKRIGQSIAMLHLSDIIHGDLTTSNLMVRNGTSSVVVIDFGLSYISNDVEDKAVDLYVLERAFLSTHPDSESMVTHPSPTLFLSSGQFS